MTIFVVSGILALGAYIIIIIRDHSGNYFYVPVWHMSFQNDGPSLKYMGFTIYKGTKNVSEGHTCSVNDGSISVFMCHLPKHTLK